ncbi:hypothetical protein GCM10010399_54170 [Dactylosporangium fulvum]|uniref:Maltokinase N-terminal cap domain-containing protein n=1 Tax=Dactylosporangium fulvum TaxID=53359 RepID=A0ABY5WCF9_9ACTN|nr:hypothetical protein [Dactylosporangium fulvum]UWP87222.1 hypothetical protein Dfulv_24455 [Dactylosporangium fulvum]
MPERVELHGPARLSCLHGGAGGEPVVLLHGLAGSAAELLPTASALLPRPRLREHSPIEAGGGAPRMHHMALLHRAELTPSKLELLAGWLPAQGWHGDRDAGALARVAAYRFDDPAGEVGIEAMLVSAGDGAVFQVPLTYRGAPLAAAEAWLIGTTDHSVLGKRWVYDACGDSLYATVLASAILGDTRQAVEYLEVDGQLQQRAASMTVTAPGGPGLAAGAVRRVVDGDPTLIETDTVTLAVVRALDLAGGAAAPAGPSGRASLTGTWADQPTPVPLAYASPR